MIRPALSVVVPVYNEAAVLSELVRRCVAAANETHRVFELIIVDDGSTDATGELAASLATGPIRHLRLTPNRGQFSATQAGLAKASGELVAVLDGDLQDPPEVIPALCDALSAHGGETRVAFAVKTRRTDPLWVRVGAAVYHALQSSSGSARVPPGAGSFCVMPASMAAAVARLPAQSTNLAAVLVALGASPIAVPYEKAARASGRSRVGLMGLVKEAFASLLVTGALNRAALGLSLLAAAAAIVLAVSRNPGWEWVFSAGAGLGALGVWSVTARRHRLTEAPSRQGSAGRGGEGA